MKKFLLAALVLLPLNSFAIYVLPHNEATAWRATYAGNAHISKTNIAVSMEERKPAFSIMPVGPKGKKPLKLYRLVLREEVNAEEGTVVPLENLKGKVEISLESSTGAGLYKFRVTGRDGETLLVEFERIKDNRIMDRESFYLEPLLVTQ